MKQNWRVDLSFTLHCTYQGELPQFNWTGIDEGLNCKTTINIIVNSDTNENVHQIG